MAVKVKVNRAAVRALLKEQAVLDDLERRARQVAAAAGEGHEVSARIGKNRARASVITTTFDAMYREATSRALTRAIDAGRG